MQVWTLDQGGWGTAPALLKILHSFVSLLSSAPALAHSQRSVYVHSHQYG